MDRQQLEASRPAEIAEAIGQTHALMATAHATLLELVAVFDRQEAWRKDGATSMACWLEASLGISWKLARQWVTTARALEELPAISGAYLEGRLSAEAVAAVAEVATPETDQRLAEEAPGRPLVRLQEAAQLARAAARKGDPARRRRSVRWWWDDDWFRLSARLPAADGATVATSIERLAATYGPDPETGMYEPAANLADALVELAAVKLGEDADGDRATVVVHVDAHVLAADSGAAELENGPGVAAEVARRLACDARVEVVAEGATGPVGIGRAGRQVPPWLNRQLRRRDKGCRFPGCGRRRHLQAHHVEHWASGGPTDASNLVMVCSRHHHLVHDDGWTITGSPDAGLAFVRPDGEPFVHGPPAVGEELKELLIPWGLIAPDTS